jgi:membrane-bound ClpP family serine protease
MCHLILASPALALPLFIFLPFGTALPVYLAVVLVSAFVYLKVVAAMKSRVHTGLEAMTGEEAVVVEDINPEGRVRFGHEIWEATGKGKKFIKGKKVRIREIQGLRLIVEPLDEGGRNERGQHCWH